MTPEPQLHLVLLQTLGTYVGTTIKLTDFFFFITFGEWHGKGFSGVFQEELLNQTLVFKNFKPDHVLLLIKFISWYPIALELKTLSVEKKINPT